MKSDSLENKNDGVITIVKECLRAMFTLILPAIIPHFLVSRKLFLCANRTKKTKPKTQLY